MDQRKNRTTIQISTEIRDALRNELGYKKINGKHYFETYDDLLIRMLNIKIK
jgi:predicted metal-dependent hydrolase